MIRLKCPHCGGVVKSQLRSIVPGRTRNCPNCREDIVFTRGDVGRAVNYMENNLRKGSAHA